MEARLAYIHTNTVIHVRVRVRVRDRDGVGVKADVRFQFGVKLRNACVRLMCTHNSDSVRTSGVRARIDVYAQLRLSVYATPDRMCNSILVVLILVCQARRQEGLSSQWRRQVHCLLTPVLSDNCPLSYIIKPTTSNPDLSPNPSTTGTSKHCMVLDDLLKWSR